MAVRAQCHAGFGSAVGMIDAREDVQAARSDQFSEAINRFGNREVAGKCNQPVVTHGRSAVYSRPLRERSTTRRPR